MRRVWRQVAVIASIGLCCLLHACSQGAGPARICECLNPDDDPKVRREWEKVERRLGDFGIPTPKGAPAGTERIIYTVPAEKAGSARQTIAEMLERKEFNNRRLKLEIIHY